jgi:hypothetical protein
LATANEICLRFQEVAAESAAFLAFWTAETRPAAGTDRMLAMIATGSIFQNRRRQPEGAMVLILIAGHHDGMEADSSSYAGTHARGERLIHRLVCLVLTRGFVLERVGTTERLPGR